MSVMPSGVRTRVCVVVLAEGDAALRALHTKALRESGFIVEEAANGREALILAQAGRASLLVLDRHLPDGDGWNVARALKADGAHRPLTIVGLAWHRERADVESALIAGCDAFLEKSSTSEALVRYVRGMLDLPLEEHDLVASFGRR